MVQAGCRTVTAEARIRSKANPSGNFSVKFWNWCGVFFPRALILPCQHHSPSSPSSDFSHVLLALPVPVPARSKAWVFGHSPAEVVGSNPTGGMDVCLL